MQHKMKPFYTIIYDVNHKKFVKYNVMHYFLREYIESRTSKYLKTPQTKEEFIEFVKEWGMYQFWSRCQYEIIITDWPGQTVEEKIDVWDQMEANLSVVADILMENVASLPKTKKAAEKRLDNAKWE